MKITLEEERFHIDFRPDQVSRSAIDRCVILMHKGSTLNAIQPCDLSNNKFIGSGHARVYAVHFTRKFPWLKIERLL